MFTGQNVIVLDLEVAVSPDACIYCWQMKGDHWPNCEEGYEAIGWYRKRDLGISVGCYYDYQTGRLHWIDEQNLASVMQSFVDRQPLMVSFNGISFDFALMRAILRAKEVYQSLCDQFKELSFKSYDILAEIWHSDPGNKFSKGLNSLGAICECNGLGEKLLSGELAPVAWREGRYAQVLDYVSDDVYKTKALLELICKNNGQLKRNGPPVTVRYPSPVEPLLLNEGVKNHARG